MMQAILLLADSAQVDSQNKIHALGLGWSVTSTPTPPAAVCCLILVPWTATNRRHRFVLHLLDGDGTEVQTPGETPAPLRIEGEFEMGRPPGAPSGSPLTQPFVLAVPAGLELQRGQTYDWRLDIDGHHESDWTASFFVRPE